jgi:predicted dehydrogenase
LQSELGPQLDGVLVATPHATHYAVGGEFLEEIDRRKKDRDNNKPLHILMEKPMTTDILDAINLFNLVQTELTGDEKSQFWINHTANYRAQTALARETITSGKLGRIRHVTASFAAPLKWIFNDPGNEGWNKPTGSMVGNGFAWGQSSHLLAWLFHILPHCEPKLVHCRMSLSKETGADIAHSATVECLDLTTVDDAKDDTPLSQDNTVIINMSGTALLPGHQYSNPPIAKLINIEVYGDNGSLHYNGNDQDPASGHMEYRSNDGSITVLSDRFEFEAYDNENLGPESIQSFVELCCGEFAKAGGATALDGLRSVQVIDAMYRSNASNNVEPVIAVNATTQK